MRLGGHSVKVEEKSVVVITNNSQLQLTRKLIDFSPLLTLIAIKGMIRNDSYLCPSKSICYIRLIFIYLASLAQ